MEKKNIETLKTITIIVLALTVVFGGSYFASELKSARSGSVNQTNNQTNSGNNAGSDEIDESEQGDLTDINIDDYLTLKKGEEKAIIYIARPTCGFCQEEEPIVKNIVYEYGVEVNYLNTDNLDDEGQGELIKSDDYFSKGYGTPLLIIVENDKIVDKIEGLSTKDNIVSVFKKHGFISE